MEQEFDLSKTTRITFDPAKSDWAEEGASMKEVWADPEARMFYIAYRKHHLVNQYFLKECLTFARFLREKPPQTAEELATLIGAAMPTLAFYHPIEWAKAYLPYVKGEKKLSYVINPDGVSDEEATIANRKIVDSYDPKKWRYGVGKEPLP